MVMYAICEGCKRQDNDGCFVYICGGVERWQRLGKCPLHTENGAGLSCGEKVDDKKRIGQQKSKRRGKK